MGQTFCPLTLKNSLEMKLLQRPQRIEGRLPYSAAVNCGTQALVVEPAGDGVKSVELCLYSGMIVARLPEFGLEFANNLG